MPANGSRRTGWRSGSHSGSPGPAGILEAQVTAARLAASAGRNGAVFLPLLLARPQALRRNGSPEAQLGRWLAGAEQATLAALLHLDRLDAWREKAATKLARLSGRTPPRLVAALAEVVTGASRAAVQRNLDIMATAGLIREVTGQGRFRMWAAKM